ncbi:MAG: cobalamin-binding protein [Gemmatimonadales bacterium]|nr:cobalamin-binding protein [Gemmatimonadales bacterium]
MLRFRHTCSYLGLAAALTISGCGPTSRATGEVRILDDAGDAIILSQPARRVVSLVPATTELLFAIGAGSNVVGRTAWCDYPAAVESVPNLGDGLRPNLEAIVAQRPDLVVLYNSSQNATAVSQLRQLGIPAIRLNTDRLDQVSRNARILGQLTGRETQADSVVTAFEHQLADASFQLDSPPKVFLLAWDQPPMTIGGGSFQSEIVARAGGRNVFGDLLKASGPVSIEAVAARDPDVILFFDDATPGLDDRPEWKAVRAVRERRFLVIGGTEFSRPGPRAPEAIRTLATHLRALPR